MLEMAHIFKSRGFTNRMETMQRTMTRASLVKLVEKLQSGEGTDEEISEWLDLLMDNVPDPSVSNLIFYPEVVLSADEVVDTALSYQPVCL